MNWRGKEFFKVTGEVTSADIWSETKVAGDKNHISSSSEAKQCYWIRYGEEKETDVVLPLAHFNAKVGHKVTLVAVRTKGEDSITCLIFNHTTGKGCGMNDAFSVTLSGGKKALFWLGLLAGGLITFIGSISNSGPTVILGLCLVGPALWYGLKSRSDEKAFYRAAEDYAKAV